MTSTKSFSSSLLYLRVSSPNDLSLSLTHNKTAVVVLVSEFTHHKLEISNQMLTVLGTVLGLVISFRTTSAYERFQDGRKLWSNIMVASRNIAMMVSLPELQGRHFLY